MTYQNIIVDTGEYLGRIFINRPKQLNALNMETLIEIEKAMRELEENSCCRAIIISGAGEKAFVAGADIAAMSEMSSEEADEFCHQGHSTMNIIELSTKPVIAQVNGYALGGGMELALACDIVYASANAKFGLPETTLGLFPGFGGTQRLPRLIGVSKAKELIFTGKVLSADEAYQWGIVNRVVANEDLAKEVEKLACQMSINGPNAISLAKKVIFEGQGLKYPEALENERKRFEQIFTDQDHKEGLIAFLEKRSPEFRGV